MYKCKNCGHEYEGKFCPECGARRGGSKSCPGCGAEVEESAKFCPECGYNFATGERSAETVKPAPKERAAVDTGALAKLSRVLSFVPTVLFALYSLALFGFFAAPLAIMPAKWFGEAQSYGSVYTFTYDDRSADMIFRGPVIAMIVVAALAAAIALALLRRKAKGAGSPAAQTTYFAVSALAYVTFIIFSSVLRGKAEEADGGLGMVEPGLALALILGFAIAFLIAETVAFAGEKLISVSASREGALSDVDEQERRARWQAAHDEPKPPAAVSFTASGKEKREHRRAVLMYKKEYKCWLAGKPYKQNSVLLWLGVHRPAAIVWTAAVAVFATIAFVIAPAVTSIFRPDHAMKVELGADKEDVRSILGEPNAENGNRWLYYEKSVARSMDELNDLNEQMMQALVDFDSEKLESLQKKAYALTQKLKNKVFKFILVGFDGNDRVVEIFYDTKHKADENVYATVPKTDKSVSVYGARGFIYYIDETDSDNPIKLISYAGDNTATYQIEFEDKSFYKYRGSFDWNGIELVDNGTAFLWTDTFGEHKCPSWDPTNGGTQVGTISESGKWTMGRNFKREELTSFTFPSNVKEIGSDALSGCRKLTNVTIPGGVTSIGDKAFYNCESLTEITLPAGVNFIGAYAFYGCKSLTGITIPYGVTSIEVGAFYGCESLAEITLPAGVTFIGADAFLDCKSLTEIVIPSSVTVIDHNAFFRCTALQSVKFDAGSRLKTIGDNAFVGSAFDEIVIPASVTYIGDSAFNGCDLLTSVKIPASVTYIGDSAFRAHLQSAEFEVTKGWIRYGFEIDESELADPIKAAGYLRNGALRRTA